MANITKQLVDRARPPDNDQNLIWDDRVKGFGLRISSGNCKSFIWQGRINGRMRRITLGQCSEAFTVADARRRALEVKSKAARGEDAKEERDRKRQELTFRNLSDRWIEDYSKPHKPNTWKRDLWISRRSFARWYSRRLSDITPEEIDHLKNEIGDKHGKVMANRTITLLCAMFNKASDWGLFEGKNPAARIKKFQETPRERFLTDDDMKRLNQALADEPNEMWRAYFALLLMLGTRRSELLSARWEHVDLLGCTLRLPTTKSGRPHILPLPADAIAFLEGLNSRNWSEWIFPNRTGDGHAVEVKSAWKRVRDRAGIRDVRMHDLRRTLASWLLRQGYPLPVIAKVLNHKSLRSTEIYARLDMRQVRDALESNAKVMNSMTVATGKANLQTLRHANDFADGNIPPACTDLQDSSSRVTPSDRIEAERI